MFSSPIAAYQQVGLESEVIGADPHQLIVLLFDGADSALTRALELLAKGDFKGKSDALTHATNIIMDGLCASLNLAEGGELAEKLSALYQYMATRLVHANANRDANAIVEVQQLLNEIGGAWREIKQT